MNIKKEDITCPHCGKSDTWTNDNIHRPFCSERCKLIDLGEWAQEKYRIPLAEEKLPESDDDLT